jgi:hypothetical protein
LALANPNIYNAQISSFNESLTTEAIQNNKFAVTNDQDTGASQSTANDALFSGKPSTDHSKGDSTYKFVKVQYTDEKNGLRRLAPHPFYPLEAEKGQLMLPPLLLPKPDEQVVAEEETRWKAWREQSQVPEKKFTSQERSEEEKHWITSVRDQIKEHDTFAAQAIRSFVHAREATDELGQRYDWKMRMDPDEPSEDEEDEEDDDDDEDMGGNDDLTNVGPSKKRRRAGANGNMEEEAVLSLQQVAAFLSTGDL